MSTEIKQPTTAEKEVALLKVVFKDNDALLKSMLSLWFGFDISEAEKELIKGTFVDKDLREAVRKKIFPILSNDVPIGEVQDYWIGVDQNILGQNRDTIAQIIGSKQQVFDMLKTAMVLLENPDAVKMDLTYKPSLVDDALQIGLVARTLYIKTIQNGLVMIKTIANLDPKTQEQVNEAMKKNSSK